MADYKAFGAALAGQLPGMPPEVAAAWGQCEGGPADNPLNIGPGAHFGSMEAAASATARELQNPQWAGIRAKLGAIPPYVQAGEGNRDAELARLNYNKALIHAIGYDSPWCIPKPCQIYQPNGCVERAMVDYMVGDPDFLNTVPQDPLAPNLAGQQVDVSKALAAKILEKLLDLFGIESITEGVIRLLEIVGGAAVLAVAVTMYIDVVSRDGTTGGVIGSTVRKVGRAIPGGALVVG